MKKIGSLLWLFSFLTVGTLPVFAGESAASAPMPQVRRCVDVAGATKALSVQKDQKVQGLDFRIVDSLYNAFSLYSNEQQPFIYDPTSGKLILIKRGAQNIADFPSTKTSKDEVYIMTSSDWGMTWPSDQHYPNEGGLRPLNITEGARYPSIWAIAPPSGTSPTFIYRLPINVKPDAAAAEWPWGTVVDGILDIGPSSTPYSEASTGMAANDVNYLWGTDAAMTSISNTVVVMVGSLTAQGEPATENNAFGLRRMDYDETNPFSQTIIPPQWRSNQFLTPSTAQNVGSRSSILAGLDHDNNNNIYFGIDGAFSNNNPHQILLPAVSMSSDNGLTWSEFDVAPTELIDDLSNSLDSNPDSTSLFDARFVITGNGNYNFLMSASFLPLDGSARSAWVIEIYKENGNWGARKVAPTSGLVWRFFGDEKDNTLLSTTQMGTELQLVKTVDGTKIIAKWSDFNNVVFDEVVPNSNGDGLAPDTTSSTDIFVSVRDLASGSWSSQPLNITQSKMADKVTWLPNLVPNDLKNIPMISVQALPTESETSEWQRSIDIQRRIVNRTQFIMIANFDADQAVSVSESHGADAFLMSEPVPNPVSGRASLQFILPVSGQTTLDMYNVMGQRVLSLEHGFMSAGTHNATINAQSLPAGVYYYTLKQNGVSQTKVLTIVK